MKRAVIILGAGAAHAWGAKLTNPITELLLQNNWFTTQNGEPVAKYIYDQLRAFYGGYKDGVNFETIVNALESFQDYFLSKTALGSPNFTGSLPHWFDINKKFDPLKNYAVVGISQDGLSCTLQILSNKNFIDHVPIDRQESFYLREVINHLLDLVRTEIFRYDNPTSLEENKIINKRFKDFLIKLMCNCYAPRIYTTNYDRLLPNLYNRIFVKSVFDGFDITVRKSDLGIQYAANIPRILNDTKSICYYNLHGSVHWDYNMERLDQGYEFISSSDFPPFNTSGSFGEFTNPGANTIIYNIITGYNKLQRVSIEPMHSMHSAFSKDCINADLIISAGYSYSDFHINRPIKNAFRNKNPKLIHITYSEEMDNDTREIGFIKSEILRRQDEFNSRVKTKGGWKISERGNQMIYHNGFKTFLENQEWKNIII